MSYPKNYKKNCHIFNKSFVDTVKAYDLVLDTTTADLQLVYKDTSLEPISGQFKINQLKTIIDTHKPTNSSDNNIKDIWLPAICDVSNSMVSHNEITMGYPIGKPVLGIEEFCSFKNVQLEDWNISAGSMSLCFDWLINTNMSIYDTEYGILFWYKLKSTDIRPRAYQLQEVPVGSILNPKTSLTYTINAYTSNLDPHDILIKVNNNTIKLIKTDASKFIGSTNSINEGGFVFNKIEETQLITLDQINIQDKTFYLRQDKNLLDSSLGQYDIWISSGETYSYFLNAKDKYDRQTFQTIKLPSRSYLSPCLFSKYRAIYNTLYEDSVKSFTGLGSVVSGEKLKKLCYMLATAPYMDRVTVDILKTKELKDYIREYISAPADADITSEITKTLDVILYISKYYRNISAFKQQQTLLNNFISNKKDLINCLKYKYANYLKIDQHTNASLSLKQQLVNGPHIYANFNYKTFAAKSLDPNTTKIFNDIKIDVGDITLQSQMNPDLSTTGCVFFCGSRSKPRDTVVPLCNMALPKSVEFLAPWYNKDIKIQLEPNQEETHHTPAQDFVDRENTGLVGDLQYLEENTYTNWSLVDGPNCLRFSDYYTNGKSDIMRRNPTSSDAVPTIYVKNTGLYTIQAVTTLGNVLKTVDNIRVYVTNQDDEYAPSTKAPTLFSYKYPVDKTPKAYQVMCPNLKQFIVNKYGLVWLMDTDLFYKDASDSSGFEKDTRLINKKFIIKDYQYDANSPFNRDTKFSIDFKTNNTYIKLYTLSLENIRDNTDKYSQCRSCYEPKLARQRGVNTGSVSSVARFYRKEKYPDDFVIQQYTKNSNEIWSPAESIYFGLPEASLLHAPSGYTYGGYSQSIINSIGLEIPYHPVFADGNTLSVNQLPPNTMWGASGTLSSPESGLIASKPFPLPVFSGHNQIDTGGVDIRCYMVNIPVSGSHLFEKGYFHPNSGWLSFNATSYNPSGQTAYSLLSSGNHPNISSIKKFQTDKYGSYTFYGEGFFGLRAINNGTGNQPLEYKSSISITKNPFDYFKDTDHNYGVRNWNGIGYRSQELVDDFIVDRDTGYPALFDCDFNPTVRYQFTNDSIDNLKIEDIEIKLDFINHANPKNLIVALEVYNPGLADDDGNKAESVFASLSFLQDKVFTSGSVTADDPTTIANTMGAPSSLPQTGLINYISLLQSMNRTLNPKTKILYLLNQESIDNYGHHFSLLFSDNHNKYISLSDEAKMCSSGTLFPFSFEPSTNIDAVGPTLYPTGLSQIDALRYKRVLQQNNITILDTTLAKFKKIPLKDTVFTLKVWNVGPENKVSVLDNLVYNSELAGLSSYDTLLRSNTLNNSICRWGLIIHTKPTKKFTTTDYLGSIAYDNQTYVPSGYNYIANFTDKQHLLPKVNINAPYSYLLSNICKYLDKEDLSKPMTYPQISFPPIVFLFFPFYSIIGAVAALASGAAAADPIIDMFRDLRNAAAQSEKERYYFKPSYIGSYTGVGDKVTIVASKDKHIWYRMEVPIFKYQNTAILKNNTYKYLKLYKDVAVPLSNFYFELVTELRDLLDPALIKYTFTENISLSGLAVNLASGEVVNVNEGDLVMVASQSQSEENGVYQCANSSWVKYNGSPGMMNIMTIDKIWGNNTITKDNIQKKKIIKLKGERPYNIFDRGDNIVLMKSPAATEDLMSVVVENKALMYFNNEYNTVISLSQPIDMGQGYLGQTVEETKTLLVYKDYTTFKDSEIPVGKWGLTKRKEDKTHINTSSIVNTHSVAVAEGSIGYGSLLLNPEVYSEIPVEYPNRIEDISKILNNNVNNKLKYNNITIISADNQTKQITFDDSVDSTDRLLTGFSYGSYQDSNSTYFNILNNIRFVWPTGISVDKEYQKLQNSLKQTTQNNINDNPVFLDVKSMKFKGSELVSTASGNIVLENDYMKHIPMPRISDADKTTISNRLSQLQTESSTPILINSSLIIDNISSIPDLEYLYSNLPADPSGCFKRGYYSTINDRELACSGQIVKQKLSALYQERNDLLTALDLQTHTSNVLPYYDISVSQNTTTQVVSINYKPTDYYFIHIDPDQECTIASDFTTKIWKRFRYNCSPIAESYQYPECDTICSTTNLQNATNNSNADAYIDISQYPITYVNNKLDEMKNKYPEITEWDDDNYLFQSDRSFMMSCGDNTRDTLVLVKEEYVCPKIQNQKGKVRDIFNLDNTQSLQIKFHNIPRKLKTTDQLYTKYTYDYNGNLVKTVSPPEGGMMYTTYSAWKCIKVNNAEGEGGSSSIGKYIDPPAFFKWMNEMIFRGFFGSTDGVENKNTDSLDTKEMWEWIPYEYFK